MKAFACTLALVMACDLGRGVPDGMSGDLTVRIVAERGCGDGEPCCNGLACARESDGSTCR